MKSVVAIKDIVSNPYQARKKIDRESVRALAEEIRNFGLWPGSFRGRWRSGKLELCFGHRRLEAIRMLGWEEVEVDIVDMSDDDMALQGLAENVQREGLTDLEKAEGINHMVRRYVKQGLPEQEAIQKVARQLGLSTAWAKDLLSLLRMPSSVQKAIRDKEIAGRTALEAHRLGGPKMVETAAKNSLAVHKLSKLAQKIRQIPDEKVRDKVKGEVVRGRIKDAGELDARARKLIGKGGAKAVAAPDLERVAETWCATLEEWEDRLEELALYRKALKEGDGSALKLKRLIRQLIDKLERLA
jgi:ParB/RepB/Spo0J family partition protein